ncbi:MAG TPA: FtsX-like permease family protein [Thermoanaerobaculia bacterium]|nr:FtsX-like permease family protein [Thermoanaerobaculia bacterium]
MTRHLLKLVWNRKRASILLILEIFFSFLVVFTVATLGVYLWDSYRQPLGFAYEDVWNVSIDLHQETGGEGIEERSAAFARLLQESRALPEVVAAAGAWVIPFEGGNASTSRDFRQRVLKADVNEVTQDFAKVMGLRLVAGRWFRPGDEALGWTPVVVDQDLVHDGFGSEDPLGQVLFPGNPKEGTPETRIVGVVSDFRKHGELGGDGNYIFYLKKVGDPEVEPSDNLLLKIRPGTPAAFEEELAARLQRVAPDGSFEVRPFVQARESSFRLRLAPLVAGGVIASFLLIMVALGLIGVLWQNLLQRTREFGLRRAAGASGSQVRRQILMEQLFLTGLGLLLGTVLVVQLPILDLAGFLNPEVFAAGLVSSLAAMLLLTLACAFYPSRMTSRMPPADALRYE